MKLITEENLLIPQFKTYLENKGKAESTVYSYVRVLRQFLTKERKLNSSDDYLEFLTETAIKKRCFQNVYAITAFIKFYVEDARVKNDILKAIEDRKIKQPDPIKYKDKKALSKEEIVKVINNLEKEKHQIMMCVMYETGLRAGDVLRIRKNGIYWDKEEDQDVLRIKAQAKGGKERTVTIWNVNVSKLIMKFVNKYDFGTDYIFVKQKKFKHSISDRDTEYTLRQHNYYWFWDDIKRTLEGLSIDRDRFATHSIRRHFARRALKTKDISLFDIKEMLGHSDVNTTLKYLREEGYNVSKSLRKMQM